MNCINFKIRVKNILLKPFEIIADIFWPKRCIVCRCFTPVGRKSALCSDCRKLIPKLSADFVEPDRSFEQAICALPYKDYIRESMIRYKFSSYRYLRNAFCEAICKCLENHSEIKEYTHICPVPIDRMRDREYNQSLLIANDISEKYNLTLCPDLLVKIKHLPPLSKMGFSMRKINIRGGVEFNLKYDIRGKNILLVDDIYTTGSTADECSRILRMNGAENVTVISACYAQIEGDDYYGDADTVGI